MARVGQSSNCLARAVNYYIVDRVSGGTLGSIRDFFRGTANWFSLYRDDGIVDDQTLVNGARRGEFRLHYGTISKGCVTVPNQSDYDKIYKQLKGTQQGVIPGTSTSYYGTIDVFTPESFIRALDFTLYGV